MERELKPKTLAEAVQIGLCMGPLNQVIPRTQGIVFEWLEEKFQEKIASSGPEAKEALTELWKDISAEQTEANRRSEDPGPSEG